MAAAKMALISVVATTYPAIPQLDAGFRGAAAAAHMTPLGPAIFVSLDGINDHAQLNPAAGVSSASFTNPFYTKMYARLAVAGASTVQLIIEGA